MQAAVVEWSLESLLVRLRVAVGGTVRDCTGYCHVPRIASVTCIGCVYAALAGISLHDRDD